MCIMTFTVDSEMPQTCLDACAQRAKVMPKPTLDVGDLRPQLQEYAVISMLGPHTRQQADIACVQILGVFPTAEVANAFAKQVSLKSPSFDLFVVQMCKWLPLNGSPEQSTNEVWRNEKVQELFDDYVTNVAMTNEVFNERKSLLTGTSSEQECS